MRRVLRRWLPRASGVSLGLLALAGRAAAQCAMCQTALGQSPEGQRMAAGFNGAILFLLAAPYLVFAVLVGSIWWSRRRAAAPAAADREPRRLGERSV